MLIILIMIEEKFTPKYFEDNYYIGKYRLNDGTIIKPVVFRKEYSRVESQSEKERCLRECFTYFIGEDLITIKTIKQHFKTDGKLRRDLITRCCCSQHVVGVYEDDEIRVEKNERPITHAIVTHILTNISFIVGKDCFTKLFCGADDIDTFFKETCNYCGEIVAKRADNRPNFCNQKCVKKYEEQEEKKERLLKEEAWKKKWEEEAPLRKAEAERQKELCEKWKEQKNKKPVYTHCLLCHAPKTIEHYQKFALCFKCHMKKKNN